MLESEVVHRLTAALLGVVLASCVRVGDDQPAALPDAGVSAPTDTGPAATPVDEGPRPGSLEAYAAPGPHFVAVDRAGPDERYIVYSPEPRPGARYPIVAWGNGAGRTNEDYAPFLEHLASHGLLVIATDNETGSSAAELLDAIAFLDEAAIDPESPWFGQVGERAATVGHARGGAGAIDAATDPRVTCTVPISSLVGNVRNLRGPMFLTIGAEDVVVAPDRTVRDLLFDRSPVRTFFGILRDADHATPTGDAGRFRGPVTAWLAYFLQDDALAGPMFLDTPCGLCGDPFWDVERRNIF